MNRLQRYTMSMIGLRYYDSVLVLGISRADILTIDENLVLLSAVELFLDGGGL